MDRMPAKVLCIVFKYLGDVAVALPAVRALKHHWPHASIQLLVADEAAPLVKTLPWVDRVWPLPRTRGKARLLDSWPMIRALREENFDLSLDFVGNDRGALLSLAVGAQRRLGLNAPRGFRGRALCYHERIAQAPTDWHETRRHLYFLRSLGVPMDAPVELELKASPEQAAAAAELLPRGALIGHITTSKPLKEWPLNHWAYLARRAAEVGLPIYFSAGPSSREQSLLRQLKDIAPEIPHLPQVARLDLYLAVLARARVLISGDTGPMHFAAGLGVPTLSLFGPSRAEIWAPLGPTARHLTAPGCTCSAEGTRCSRASSCFEALPPELVWTELQALLATPKETPPLMTPSPASPAAPPLHANAGL